MHCRFCELRCVIPDGGLGRCRMYTGKDGAVAEVFPERFLTIYPVSIETVPSPHFHPRAKLLQIMRFVPFGDARLALEPTIRAAEADAFYRRF